MIYEELAQNWGSFRKQNTKMAALTFIDDFILGIISSHTAISRGSKLLQILSLHPGRIPNWGDTQIKAPISVRILMPSPEPILDTKGHDFSGKAARVSNGFFTIPSWEFWSVP